MVGKVVSPVLTVNPVTPIEIGLEERDALYNLPQLIRPRWVAIPGLLLLKLPVKPAPTPVVCPFWILQVISPFSPVEVIAWTL